MFFNFFLRSDFRDDQNFDERFNFRILIKTNPGKGAINKELFSKLGNDAAFLRRPNLCLLCFNPIFMNVFKNGQISNKLFKGPPCLSICHQRAVHKRKIS